MRKFFIVLIALAFGTACERTKIPPQSVPVSVEIAPAAVANQPFSAPSKVDNFTFFTEGSKVGIYMVNYDATTPKQLLSTGNHADNECFTAGVDGVLRKVPALFYPLPEVATLVDIYAYYPFADVMKSDVSKCPFEVSEDQSDEAKIMGSDLCWAKNLRGSENVGITPSARPVAMEFVHKFSKIRVEINIPSISSAGKEVSGISNVRINGAYLSTTMNLATGVVTLKNSETDLRSSITPLSVAAGTPGGDKYVYDVIIAAQTLPLAYSLVTFDLNYKDGTSLTLSYKVTQATFGASKNTTLEGKIHRITLTLSEGMEILLTGSQITDWTTGINVSGVVDNQVTTSFKVTLSGSSVTTVDRVVMKTDFEGNFDITDGVTFSGGVCQFKFDPNDSPRDYGFRITSLQFYDGQTAVTNEIIKTSARVYTKGEMDLGVWQ